MHRDRLIVRLAIAFFLLLIAVQIVIGVIIGTSIAHHQDSDEQHHQCIAEFIDNIIHVSSREELEKVVNTCKEDTHK